MHNKVLVIDRRIAIVGGRNIQNAYFDLDRDFAYLDRDVLVAGPAADRAAWSFEAYWDSDITVPMASTRGVANHVLEYGRGELVYDDR